MINSGSSASKDRFEGLERVGGGASGDIYKGTDSETGKEVALKVLRKTATPSEHARFKREIKVIADLRHPNIVDYVGQGEWEDGRLFLAMEWLEGEDLSKHQRRSPLGTRDAVEVVRRSSQALAAIHSRGIVHRDMKLSNIFLIGGRGTSVKLIDFGVVKLPETDEYNTEPGTILGTPHYMAPEQARGEDVDPRADVYALGSVLFRLLTGRNVFETDHVIALLGRLVLEDPPHPGSLRFDIPERLDHVVHRALSRNRDERFPHAGEFARALARVGQLNNDPPSAERSASAVRPARPRRSSTGTDTGSDSRNTRPAFGVRRVVACMIYDLGDTSTERSISQSLVDVSGEDVRIEQLAGGKTVAVLGVAHSRGDEVMRAARAALQVIHDYPEARAVVTSGHAVMARSNLAGEALERAAEQLDSAAPGLVRLDIHAAAALETRFVIQRDTTGAQLLKEDPRDLAPRLVLGQPTPTVGREKEITQLLTLYHDMLQDSFPRAAVVLGHPGIGKSRVLSELMQRLELAPQPPEVLVCRGDGRAGGSSVSTLGRALRTRMGVQDGARLDDQVDRVRRYIRSRLPRSLHFLAAFIGELVGVRFPDETDEPLRAARANDQLMQSRIRMALEAYIRTQAGRIPQVVVLEDAHEVDDTTFELIDWLLACPDIRFSAYAFATPAMNGRHPKLWSGGRNLRIHLGPLSTVAGERVVASVLPNLDPHKRSELVRRASGNALVLEELIRCTAEGQTEMPLTVQALMQLRLDRLSAEVHEVVRAAAVFGQTFWKSGLEKLLERTVDEDLAVAEEEEIILKQPTSRVADDAEYNFRQALVRDAAYGSLLEEDRRPLHLSAANWLESKGTVDIGLVARHFDDGGNAEKAITLYARAAQEAIENFGQMDSALELAERGLACGASGAERAQLLLTLAHVNNRMGRLSEANEAAEEATKLVAQGSDGWVEAQRVLASSLIEAGRAHEGDARISWALGPQFKDKLTPSGLSVLLATRVRGLVDLNRPGQALSVAEDAVKAAEALGDPASVAMLGALDSRNFALMTAGMPAQAVEAGEALIEAADRAGDLHLASRSRINVASSLNYLGRYEDGQVLLERALPDVRSFRLRLLEGTCIHNLGMAHARRGALDEGIEMQREAAVIADECNGARLATNARVYEAVMLTWRGAPGDLRRAHELALAVLHATETQLSLQVVALFCLATVQLARRQLNEALEAAREAHRRLGDEPIEEWEEGIRLCFVRALLATGSNEDADEALRTAFESIRQRVSAMSRDDFVHAFTTRNAEVAELLSLASSRLQLRLS